MRAWIATLHKELLLLTRDRTGLLVLFLMPAALTAVISLVQENVMKSTGDTGIRMVLVDMDDGETAEALRARLSEDGAVTLFPVEDEASAASLLDQGEYPFAVVIPQGFSDAVTKRAIREITSALSPDPPIPEPADPPPALRVLFDPLIQGAYRSAVVNALHRTLLVMEMEIKARVWSRMLPEHMARMIRQITGSASGAPPAAPMPSVSPEWGGRRLSDLTIRRASKAGVETLPTSVQQNVPAWALFGMFFIVVPLGGSLIRERRDGTLMRLLTAPAPPVCLLGGKITAYVLVCLAQFGLILAMGKYVLPALGTQVLTVGSSYDAVLAVALSASVAAASYGVLVGTVAGTYEQASMFGAVSVVIASAVGGIMVPVYVMPEFMREISRFSPLSWGLTAFTDLFVRETGISSVGRELACLWAFAAACLLASLMVFRRKARRGG